jgi:hypothetical protein
MNINRTNYESYFLLYVDRELTAVEMLAVEEFVANNPDLQPELELLQASCLPVETVPFLKKTDLYQTAEISSELQESALLYTDNELTDTERIALETRFNKEPALGQLIKELAQTKLSPAEQVAFPDKSTLYRREPARVISLYFRRIAAAAVIVGIGLFVTVTVVRNRTEQPEQGMASNNGKASAHQNENQATLPAPDAKNPDGRNNAVNQSSIDSTVATDNNSTELAQTNNPTGTDNRKNRSTASPAPLYTRPATPTSNEKTSVAQQKNQRSGINENNALPSAAPEKNLEKNIPSYRNETIASNVPLSNTPDPNKLIAQLSPERDQPAKPTAPASGSGTLTALDTDITPALANADARTAGLRPETDLGSNDQYLGMDESRIKKSKLTGFLRKVKRVVERNTRIKEGSNLSIAGFAIAVK